uniref:Uncharacterized protein n=1 Tax=Oryza barthii TaxID=65489 RepID=A0A0D3F7G4_9ORYZ
MSRSAVSVDDVGLNASWFEATTMGHCRATVGGRAAAAKPTPPQEEGRPPPPWASVGVRRQHKPL